MLGDTVLTVAAVLGALCIALVIAAALFDVRIILFSTGSMSPTIPAGSAAVVRQIPAAEVHVGDVITVDRPGKLPITHRATSVTTVPDAADDVRRITMRGDANPVDDPFPYDVAHVRLVVLSVPGIAPAVAALGNPWVLGTVTVAATALVVWVFWPRRSRRGDGGGGGGAHDAGDDDPTEPRRGVTSGLVTGAALLLVTGAVLAQPAPAQAADGERVIQGDAIRLVSIDEPRMRDLAPGVTAVWQVGISADAPTPGTVTVQLSSTGDAALALRYDVRACPVRWADAGCSAPTTILSEQPVPLDGAERDILTMPSDEQRWLRVAVTRPADGDAEAAGAVDIVVRAVGVGDDVSTVHGGELPVTGAGVPWTLAGFGLVLLAAGTGVAVRARQRRSS